MRKLLLSVALATATVAAVPAAAQDYGRSGYDQRGDRGDWRHRGPSRVAVNNLLRQLDQIDSRIVRAERRGTISRREAFSLRREANQIRARLGIEARHGLSGREFASLQVQVNRLEQRLRVERRDYDRRPG